MENEEVSAQHDYLVMWCCEGLETLINLTVNEAQAMVDILAEKPVTWSNPIQYMILRARFNEQRNYEIYTFHTSIKEEDLIREFEERPQVIVDAIRRVGKKLYGVEKPKDKNVIV